MGEEQGPTESWPVATVRQMAFSLSNMANDF